MLVVISDLHFTDGTTSNRGPAGQDLFNVNPRAFEVFLRQISNIVERRRQRNVKIKTVRFIYNGDIFDPLRTHVWFGVHDEERPWSTPLRKAKVCRWTHKILQDIVEKNKDSLAWLSGTHSDFERAWPVESEIERIYVPGNHDRLINLYGPSRKLVREKLLGMSRPTGTERFDNEYHDRTHRALVMHGHETDAFNCEYDTNGDPDYDTPPIGDAMTTMLFAHLGYKAAGLRDVPREAKRRFNDIDNVRPHLAAVRYVQDIIRDFGIGAKVKHMIKGVVKEFEKLEFYDAWQDKHDRWNIGFDEADKLQLALGAIKVLGTSVPAGWLQSLAAFVRDGSCEKWAVRRLREVLAKRTRYCILGHTHEPVHVPLLAYSMGTDTIEKHYLNCGTFRTTFGQTHDGQDFLRFQRMSFVIIYGPREYDADVNIPVYEMWSGLRLHH
ncbi:MAG: hypothetical protein ACYST6_14110 [Planctomycetota bacterium]|jgi:hypothetical protein